VDSHVAFGLQRVDLAAGQHKGTTEHIRQVVALLSAIDALDSGTRFGAVASAATD
jgi:L-asparaginase II